MENEDSDKKVLKLTPIELKGIFTEFSRKTRGRIYRQEDYLPHIEELKKKKKKI